MGGDCSRSPAPKRGKPEPSLIRPGHLGQMPIQPGHLGRTPSWPVQWPRSQHRTMRRCARRGTRARSTGDIIASTKKAGPLSERPGQLLVDVFAGDSQRRCDSRKKQKSPRQLGERNSHFLWPLCGRSFRRRRYGTIGRDHLGRCATAALDRSTAARLAAATTTAESSEQAVPAAAAAIVTAGTTTAGLHRTATTRFDRTAAARLNHRTRRLRRTPAAWLSRAATARFCCTATAAVATAEQSSTAGISLAFQQDRHAHQRCHSDGGSQHKTLTHRNSSKKQRNTNPGRKPTTASPAAHVTKNVWPQRRRTATNFVDLSEKRPRKHVGRLWLQAGKRS